MGNVDFRIKMKISGAKCGLKCTRVEYSLNLILKLSMSDQGIRDFIQHDRHDFHSPPLLESDAPKHPMQLFERWFAEVIEAKLDEPYAFSLATADRDTHQPSLRVVYMRDIRPEGIVFYTNYSSEKGSQLDGNSQFSANFFWSAFHRQVRMGGEAVRLPASDSDTYFASRPRESQLGAWASHQSEVINGRAMLSERLSEIEKRFDGQMVPRPDFWGGYLLRAKYFEFWQGRESRLHDRLVYRQIENDFWTLNRLSP